MKKKNDHIFDVGDIIIGIFTIVVTIVLGINQIGISKEQNVLSKKQNDLSKEQAVLENKNKTYLKYLDNLSYDFSILLKDEDINPTGEAGGYERTNAKPIKGEKVKYEPHEVVFKNEPYSVNIPLPLLRINTGYINKISLFNFVNGEMNDVSSLRTSSFLRENRETLERDPQENELTPCYTKFDIPEQPEYKTSEGKNALSYYYFVLIEGIDGSKSLNLVSYVFDYNNSDMNFSYGKIYPESYIMDKRAKLDRKDNSLDSLSKALIDFRDLWKELKSEGML